MTVCGSSDILIRGLALGIGQYPHITRRKINFSIILFVCEIFVIIVLAMTNMNTNGKHCMVVRDNNNDFSIGFQFRFIGNNDQVVRLTKS